MLDITQSGKATDSSLNRPLRQLLATMRMDHTWERAEGVWVTDSNGRRFLDCYAQYGALALGHNAASVRATIHAALTDREPALVQLYRARYASVGRVSRGSGRCAGPREGWRRERECCRGRGADAALVAAAELTEPSGLPPMDRSPRFRNPRSPVG